MAIARDTGASTFPVTTSGTGGSSVISPSFSTSQACVLVVCVSLAAPSNEVGDQTVAWTSGTPSGATGWTRLGIAEWFNSSISVNTSAVTIWTATCSSPLSGASITVTCPSSGVVGSYGVTIDALLNTNGFGNSASQVAPDPLVFSFDGRVTVSGVSAGSWIYVVLAYAPTSGNPSAVANTSNIVDHYDSFQGDENLVGLNNAGTTGSIQVGWTISDNTGPACMLAFEVLAPPAPLSHAPRGSFDPEEVVLAWFDPELLPQRGPWLNVSGNSNLLLSPEQIGDGNWIVSGATISATLNFAPAPDGTSHATRGLVTDASGHALYETATVSPSTTYTFSFLAKNNGGTKASYSVYDNTHNADIVATTSYFAQLNGVSYVKVRITFTTPAGATSINVYPLRDSGGTVDLLVWGAKLELGSLATGYARAAWTSGWFDWDLLGPVTVYETAGALDAEMIVKAWFDYELIGKRNWFDWELPLPSFVPDEDGGGLVFVPFDSAIVVIW